MIDARVKVRAVGFPVLVACASVLNAQAYTWIEAENPTSVPSIAPRSTRCSREIDCGIDDLYDESYKSTKIQDPGRGSKSQCGLETGRRGRPLFAAINLDDRKPLRE